MSRESLLIFRALSHRVRLRVLLVMGNWMLSPEVLAEVMGISVRQMRGHLVLLQQAGLVREAPVKGSSPVYGFPAGCGLYSPVGKTMGAVINWQKWNPLFYRDRLKLVEVLSRGALRRGRRKR